MPLTQFARVVICVIAFRSSRASVRSGRGFDSHIQEGVDRMNVVHFAESDVVTLENQGIQTNVDAHL